MKFINMQGQEISREEAFSDAVVGIDGKFVVVQTMKLEALVCVFDASLQHVNVASEIFAHSLATYVAAGFYHRGAFDPDDNEIQFNSSSCRREYGHDLPVDKPASFSQELSDFLLAE